MEVVVIRLEDEDLVEVVVIRLEAEDLLEVVVIRSEAAVLVVVEEAGEFVGLGVSVSGQTATTPIQQLNQELGSILTSTFGLGHSRRRRLQ